MRVQTFIEDREKAVESVANKLEYRMGQKGTKTFISTHEILGVIAEEYDELIDAVRNNHHGDIREELRDIAVACIFAIVSIDKKSMDW